MKTIHLVMRKDYTKAEPVIAFDNEEDANDFAALLADACDRDFEVFHAPYSTKTVDIKLPVYGGER